MSLIHRSHLSAIAMPPAIERVPRWGHLSRSVSHYSSVDTVLAIYPPDSSDAERGLAEANRLYTPLSVGGSVVVWIVLCAVGVPPLLAAVALAAVLLPIGVALSRRSRDIRSRTVTLSSTTPGLRDGTAEERMRQRRLDTLAEALGDASLACRRGIIDRDEFDRLWRAAYVHASTPSRP